jgi:aryl sulfotransferase
MPVLSRAATRTPYRTPVMDSTRWDGFRPRTGDIVVATYPKCGTTWTQRIVDLLVFQSPAPRPVTSIAPWLDATFIAPLEQDLATLEAQTHRRSIKSHLPFDALPLFDEVKYIHVVRDGRDACMSMHNHELGFMNGGLAHTRPARPIPDDPREFFLQWIANAGAQATGQLWFFDFENTYWRERRRKNLLFVHYNDLKRDLAGQMARIADFLDIAVPKPLMRELAEAASFDRMRADGDTLMPVVKLAFDKGAERFLNKGTNGRWKDCLTADDLARYDAAAKAKFSPAEARWIAEGSLSAGDPRDLPD